ncbi:efflux RND transporter periplasmic adaptor subunit [Solimicrobium silvestre]|uniref:Efflux transporter, RND family, MFP subunit n=1 Tax=Solimicrobium silvestre TaxID=2099400 RepID=A0A2S9H531_9BURK|nr:efflux RND transporter periplasmic adaptor subunit [Solimicrobium silvestre]PRC95078.1 Efflux transporter, RND family, MFP subunit [Solimicrobium silvestre]
MHSIQWRNVAPLFLLITSLVLSACSTEDASNTKTTAVPAEAENDTALKLSEEEIKTAGIQVATLQEQQINEQILVTATIQPNQNKVAQIAPSVAGKVRTALVNLGDQVKQNQPLASIDSIEAGEAQSAYEQAKSEFTLAQSSFDRAKQLVADRIIPQKDYLRAQSDLEKARAGLQATSTKLQTIGIAPQNQRSNSSLFMVSAPFSGTVIVKNAVVGELAQPDKALFTIADLSKFWIETNLFEKDFSKVKVGAPATITSTAYPGELFKGKVTYIGNMVDKETHTANARIEVINLDDRLKLNMFVNAAIETSSTQKALLLPEQAIVLIQGQSTVFVQTEHGFEPRAVELGEKLHTQVVLKNGINSGEKIVTIGTYALKAKILKSQISAEH